MSELSLYLQVLGTALLLCAGVVFFLWLLRKSQLGRGKGSENIKFLAARPLSHKAQLFLIEVEGQKLLIGLGEGGPRLICKLGEGHVKGD